MLGESEKTKTMTETYLIVGCGVFGLATAVELAKRGYAVTAIDAFEPPSPWSAATDYNKIVRGEYDDEVYTKLSIEAIEAWKSDPKFKGIYNNCGRVMITPSSFKARIDYENAGIANLQRFGKSLDIEYFNGGEELSHRFEFLRYNSLREGETSKFNPYGGLAHSGNALRAVYKEARSLGVRFLFGDRGKAIHLLRRNGKTRIETKDGSHLTADKVLIALGANTARLLDLKNQQSASGLFVTFIKLTQGEYERFKDMPVLFDCEMGYFFPPDTETRLLKIALPGIGARNMQDTSYSSSKVSLPRFKNENPTDTIPQHGVREAKLLLSKYVPELAYHRLLDSKICWIGDTQDSNFIIDSVPDCEDLFVASGDSGHAFKFLPNIGRYIADKLQGKLNDKMTQLWKWKESEGFDPARCGWRLNGGYPDLSEIKFHNENKPKL